MDQRRELTKKIKLLLLFQRKLKFNISGKNRGYNHAEIKIEDRHL